MLPTQQRLGANHGAVARSHLGLKIQNKLLIDASAPQLGIEFAAMYCAGTQRRDVRAVTTPAGCLGVIKARFA